MKSVRTKHSKSITFISNMLRSYNQAVLTYLEMINDIVVIVLLTFKCIHILS